MKKKILLTLSLLVLLGGLAIYWFSLPELNIPENKRKACLEASEVAEYSTPGENKAFVTSPVRITVKDKISGKKKYEFEIMYNSKGAFTFAIFPCNIYVTKIFNYDEKRGPLPGYRNELWRFHYDGSGEPLLTLFKGEGAPDNFGQSFLVDPTETYIAFERSYLGSPSYALVIKNLNNLSDVHVLSYQSLIAAHEAPQGAIGLKQWTKDGRYFWGRIFDGAIVYAFFRLERDVWKTKVFPAPKDVLGGDALNVENGYITVHPGNIWFGFAEFEDREKAKRRVQGIGTELYIHNLITGERKFVTSTTEPLWYFKPKWLSDTELQYELPDGEKKIYKIQEK